MMGKVAANEHFPTQEISLIASILTEFSLLEGNF
jgi:hypothetical protein